MAVPIASRLKNYRIVTQRASRCRQVRLCSMIERLFSKFSLKTVEHPATGIITAVLSNNYCVPTELSSQVLGNYDNFVM